MGLLYGGILPKLVGIPFVTHVAIDSATILAKGISGRQNKELPRIVGISSIYLQFLFLMRLGYGIVRWGAILLFSSL